VGLVCLNRHKTRSGGRPCPVSAVEGSLVSGFGDEVPFVDAAKSFFRT
jgi:hypothetical protein